MESLGNRIALATISAAAAALALPAGAAALNVYAAASLRDALPALQKGPKYNFAGSNQLQLQIERGAPADLFLSASPKEAQALYRAGRCERPQTFATNRLVILVREGDPSRVRLDLRAAQRRPAALGGQRPACRSATTRGRLLARLRPDADPADEHGRLRAANVGRSLTQGGASVGAMPASSTRPTRVPPAIASTRWRCRAARSRRCATWAASCAARAPTRRERAALLGTSCAAAARPRPCSSATGSGCRRVGDRPARPCTALALGVASSRSSRSRSSRCSSRRRSSDVPGLLGARRRAGRDLGDGRDEPDRQRSDPRPRHAGRVASWRRGASAGARSC